jgi:hypothetical protein
MEYIFLWIDRLPLCFQRVPIEFSQCSHRVSKEFLGFPKSSHNDPTKFPIMIEGKEKTTLEMSLILNYVSASVIVTFLQEVTSNVFSNVWDIVNTPIFY